MHKKEHKYFEKKLTDFEEQFNEGTVDLPKEIMRFLVDWLVLHIKNVDKKYGTFLKERGVK